MIRRRLFLGAIIIILILTSGCLDMAVTTSVDPAGDIEKYQISLTMTSAVYSMMDEAAKQTGHSSFKDSILHPGTTTTGLNTELDYEERWSKEDNRVTVTLTAKHPNEVKSGNGISVERSGEYLIFRQDMSSQTPSTGSSSKSPYTDQFEKMFSVSYYLTMPGEIIESNADTINGNTAEWHRTTTKMPSVYAKSKISLLPIYTLIGIGALVLVGVGLYMVGFQRRRRTRTYSERDPEIFSHRYQQTPQRVSKPRFEMRAPVSTQPGTDLVNHTVRYVPHIQTKSPDVGKKDNSNTILKYLLIVGTVLLVGLIGASTVESFLGGTTSPQSGLGAAPEITPTAIPTTLPKLTVVARVIPTQSARTLNPYSVDPASITPNPFATRYVAPGYRRGDQSTGESTVSSDRAGIVVYVTPYPLVSVTPIIVGTTPSRSVPKSPTTTSTTVKAKTPTVSPSASPSTPPSSPPDVKGPPCICDTDTYNCGDPLAATCFGYCLAQGKGDIHRLDADNDGTPCEGDSKTPTPNIPAPEIVTTTITTIPPPEEKTYTINVLSEGYGSVSPSGQVTVNAGEDVTFQMVPDPNVVTPGATQSGHSVYNLVQIDPVSMEIPSYADPSRDPGTWGPGTGSPQDSFTPSYTFKNVQSDHTLRVIFYRGPLITC